ncbi:hypothetical protein EUX98_g2633 [Antrodiella citrinella]|uniref:Neuroguidin n=1 Tax=Antrodiella citrinella TaxID=2447956 RepID=A0A4S4MYH2_9APHY|nr:hypothetical protein EUX98_g2633 [Antrodiella citrinella]
MNMKDMKHTLDEIRESMSSAREVVKSLNERVSKGDLDTKDGISLLSVKNNIMVQYLQSLVLLSAHRAMGNSLTERAPPSQPWGAPDRGSRGSGAGDRVDAMIEGRVVLENIKLMEGKMKYQIEKLVKLAQEEPQTAQDAANDPLAFKPNPAALMDDESSEDEAGDGGKPSRSKDGIYHPPKLAPMPYNETTGKDKATKSRRGPLPSALSNLAQMDLSMPHVESASGLGSTPALTSRRAKELQHMNEFEEDNMTRLVMKKKDAKRRFDDEADVALGGIGSGRGRGRGGGFEDEFGDVLRSVGRSRGGVVGDGYEELRQKGKKESVLARSRQRGEDDDLEGEDDGPRQRKKTRFDQAVKSAKRRSNSKVRR